MAYGVWQLLNGVRWFGSSGVRLFMKNESRRGVRELGGSTGRDRGTETATVRLVGCSAVRLYLKNAGREANG